MATHYEINPDDNALALTVANRALRVANGLSTAKPGNVYIPNLDEDGFRDGTGTWIGSGSVGNGGVAQWIGDTTPPGAPTGVSASSEWGVIYAKWDGTLDGGVPEDFAYVSVSVDGTEVGRLSESGTVASDGWADGHEATVTFVAYDAARDRTGALSPNASDPTSVSVTVSDERDAIDEAVASAEQAAEEAKQTAQGAWDKAESVASEVETAVQEAKDAAQDAQDVADSLAGQLTDITTTIDGLTTTVTGAASTADAALAAATEASQTASAISSTATQALETATGALTTATEAKQTAESISATLESTYVSKADAETTYATRTELETTSSGLTASISEVSATASSALAKAAEVEVTAAGISATLTSDYLSKADAASTYATQSSVSQTAEDIRSEVSAAASTAESALTKATSVEQTVDSISSTVTSAMSTAESALTQATEAKQTADGLAQTVSETYATKVELGESIAQEVLDRNSAIEQSASAITQTVSETYQVKGDYLTDADLSIGGTNLIPKTRDFASDSSNSSLGWSIATNWSRSDIDAEGFVSADYTAPSSLAWNGFRSPIIAYTLVRDQDVTISFYAKGSTDASSNNNIRFSLFTTDSPTYYGGRNRFRDTTLSLPADGEWHKLSTTVSISDSYFTSSVEAESSGSGGTPPSDIADSGFGIQLYRYSLTDASIKKVKMELGTVATDWSPAPEDLLTVTDAEATYATQSSVTQTADSILSEVSTTYVSQTDAASTYATRSYVDQQDDSITSTVSSVQTTADSALSKATTVEQTVDSIQSTVSDLEGDVSTVTQTVSGLEVTLSSVSDTADSAYSRASYHYGTCSTAASTVAKVVTCSGFTRYTGAMVMVHFTYANTAASPTLNVNSTGAAAIRAYNSALTSSSDYNWAANSNVLFVYSGSYWYIADSAALSAASDAAKTATNYLSYSSDGLVVGDMTGSTLGYNTRLTSSAMEVRNGSTVLASYGSDTVKLGANSTSSVIDMCGGVGQIDVTSDSLRIMNLLASGNYVSCIQLSSSGSVMLQAHAEMEDDATIQMYNGSGGNYIDLKSPGINLTWGEMGLRGNVFTPLWSGTWSSGSITVPGIELYNVLAIGVSMGLTASSTDALMLVMRTTPFTDGIVMGGTNVGTSTDGRVCGFQGSISGTTFTYTQCTFWQVSSTTNTNRQTGRPVYGIYGVI